LEVLLLPGIHTEVVMAMEVTVMGEAMEKGTVMEEGMRMAKVTQNTEVGAKVTENTEVGAGKEGNSLSIRAH